jgi:S1-C subfamily serine protease
MTLRKKNALYFLTVIFTVSMTIIGCYTGDHGERARLRDFLLRPIVKVDSGRGTGSGTVIYSKKSPGWPARTYVLTCRHVLASAADACETHGVSCPAVSYKVTLFKWDGDRLAGRVVVHAEAVADDEASDLALLLLKEGPWQAYGALIPGVARISTSTESDALGLFSPVWASGCLFGDEPTAVPGIVTDLESDIEDKTYMQGTAMIGLGCSGGALFAEADGGFVLVGVPAAKSLTAPQSNFYVSAYKVRNFLRDEGFGFIIENR